VIVVHGQGYGTYDWSDHTLLLPGLPAEQPSREGRGFALGTFRLGQRRGQGNKEQLRIIKENGENPSST
jgi:hypothetical protein